MTLICKLFGHKVHQFNSERAFCTRCGFFWDKYDNKSYSKYSHPAYYKKSSCGCKEPKETYSGDAYCVYCKVKVDFDGWVRVSDSGRRMAYGNCPNCGKKVNRIIR